MKLVVAGYGSRGDVEPCAAVGRELQRRGHDVRMAVPPNMIGFVESAGLSAVAYGPDSREQQNPAADFVRNLSTKLQNPNNMLSEVLDRVTRVKLDKGATLTSLAAGADLLLAGMNEQGLAANVAEYYGIPMAAVHFFPQQVWSSGRLYTSMTKQAEDAHRRVLGLGETEPSTVPRGSLEIQAYDELGLPELAAQWAESDIRRPFVGALTLEMPTNADHEALSWIAAGTPPIYFGFGSTPLAAFADTVALISTACARLGERALICAGVNDVTQLEPAGHVKIVDGVNHGAVFPECRAVVHHGGAGTTAAGMRAGIPILILWLWLDQPIWAESVTRLKVGSGRRFSATTQESLVADLRLVLSPEYVTRAREVADQMTTPAQSIASAADLVEDSARLGRVG